MSKKYSKWLVGAALLGAAAGAGLAYFKKHKKEKENWEDDFEDFEDDFLDDDLEDFDGEDAADAREYVTIPSSSVPEEAAENAADTAEPFSKKKQTKRPSKLRLSLNMQKQKANQKTLTKKKLFRKRQKKWLLMLPKKNQRKKRRKLKF